MKIGLFGYGKMGKEIEKIALSRNHMITAKVDADNHKENFDLSETDVIIEFSVPDSAEENIRFCLDQDKPIVVGTTGWYDSLPVLSDLCDDRKGAFLYATNFSVGVNVFFEINKRLAEIMNDFEDYKVALKEVHHTQKLDSPSGTGISLAEQIIRKINRYSSWENVKKSEISDESVLSIESVRLPDVPGTHSISYSSEIDTIDITHTAHNRKGFALGAVLSAEWIVGKKGVFTMSDVLNF